MFIVTGAGSGGLVAAYIAAAVKAKVTLIGPSPMAKHTVSLRY